MTTATEGDPGAPVPAPASSARAGLKGLLVRGSLWVAVGYAGSQVVRLGGNLVLWRLLVPKAFGVMAIVNVLMTGLQMFSDVGIGPSIIQNKRGEDPTYLNTAWTIQVIRGFMLFAASAIVAAPFARFYDEPMLKAMIPLVGLGAALSGLNSTALFTAVRQVSLGRITLIDLTSQATGLLVMIGGAYVYRNVWAIVAGGLVSNLVKLALGHLALPGVRNRLLWDGECARTLLSFGRWIFASTLLTFAVGQSDRLIFGKIIPIELLGVYSIATVWSSLPIAILDRVFSSVLLPILSRLDHLGAEFEKAFREARTPGLLFAGFMCSALISGAPSLIRFLYDQRATDAVWIVQTLSVGTWLLAIETTNSTALLARGKASWMAIGSAGKLVGMVIAIPLGFYLGGFHGAVIGFSASELLRYLTSVAGGLTIGLRGYRQDLALTGVMVGAAAIGILVARGARGLLTSMALRHGRVEAFLEGLATLLVVSAVWWVVYRTHKARAERLRDR